MRKWSAVPVLTCFTVLALNIYAQSPPKPTAAVSVPRGRTLTFTLGSRIPANAPGVLVVDEQGPVSGVSARFAAGKLTVTTSPTSPPGRYLLALDMPIGAVATQVEVRVVTSRREADDLVREYNEAEAARKLANQQAFGEGWE